MNDLRGRPLTEVIEVKKCHCPTALIVGNNEGRKEGGGFFFSLIFVLAWHDYLVNPWGKGPESDRKNEKKTGQGLKSAIISSWV